MFELYKKVHIHILKVILVKQNILSERVFYR